MTTTTAIPGSVDYAAITTRQQGAWSKGDFSRVATTTLIVAERLCERVDLRAGDRVLDVAAGSGNTALAASRRWCDVTATDYVPELLEIAQRRAGADHLPLTVKVADAQALPFEDGAFDVVLSSFGVMFAPDQQRAADEMLRVCRSGGRIGMSNWSPDSLIGDWFRAQSAHVPPPAGLRSAVEWGTEDRVRELFGAHVASLELIPQNFCFRYRNAEHMLDFFRTWYGPTTNAFEAVGADGQDALAQDLLGVFRRHNRATDGTLVAPAKYVEVIAVKA